MFILYYILPVQRILNNVKIKTLQLRVYSYLFNSCLYLYLCLRERVCTYGEYSNSIVKPFTVT